MTQERPRYYPVISEPSKADVAGRRKLFPAGVSPRVFLLLWIILLALLVTLAAVTVGYLQATGR